MDCVGLDRLSRCHFITQKVLNNTAQMIMVFFCLFVNCFSKILDIFPMVYFFVLPITLTGILHFKSLCLNLRGF